jgi:hypothetical protein
MKMHMVIKLVSGSVRDAAIAKAMDTFVAKLQRMGCSEVSVTLGEPAKKAAPKKKAAKKK